ncbi:MAG: LamG domain-containing protein [Verrucomicrobiales bacterium]|nr:LamG domain-containing protein [Verrucomicrobiales bacterium]
MIDRNRRNPGTRILASSLFVGWIAASTASAQETLAEFKFDEGSGATTKSPTNSLTGSLGLPSNPDAIPVSTTDSPSGKAGDRAVQLANGAFLVVDDSPSPLLNLTTSPLTLEGWVKRDSTSTTTYEGIMGYGGAYKLGLQSSQIIFTLFGVVDIGSGLTLPNDEWHHVAAAWEPGVGVTFYLDGASSFVEETRAVGPFLNTFLNLGAERLGNAILGSIDRLRIHKALLGPEELDSVAATPKGPLPTTLVAYGFDEAAMPYQNAASTAPRPTVTGDEFLSKRVAPLWDTDTPTGSPTDRSLNFTTGGMRVVVPDPNTAIRLDTGDFTVQAWVKFGAQPGARSVLFFNNGPGAAFSFSIASRKVFVTTLGILDQPSNAAIPDDGGWHHIACVHENGKEFRFYVDGTLGETIPYTSGVLIDVRTDAQFTIGSEPNGGLPYVGKLDRLTITRGIVAADKLDFRAIPGVDPSAPELSIRTVVEISWATIPAGYQLQSSPTPDNPASWVVVGTAPIASEGTYKYYAPVTATKMFYRLVKP